MLATNQAQWSAVVAENSEYIPPRVWAWKGDTDPDIFKGERPVSGARFDRELPVGDHPLQLYSLGTPNGQKVTILLEELLALGHADAEYDAWLIKLSKGDQFGSNFVDLNPNSKIPVLLDRSGESPIRVFESGSILIYLAEKFGAFLPAEPGARAETLSWLIWQIASTPYLGGGGFGHFYAYAPIKIEYAIDRYAIEIKRQLDVLDQRLARVEYLTGEAYTIADIAVFPWYGLFAQGLLFGAGEFLQVDRYTHVLRWAQTIAERPAVARGRRVNRIFGDPSTQLAERHSSTDFD